MVVDLKWHPILSFYHLWIGTSDVLNSPFTTIRPMASSDGQCNRANGCCGHTLMAPPPFLESFIRRQCFVVFCVGESKSLVRDFGPRPWRKERQTSIQNALISVEINCCLFWTNDFLKVVSLHERWCHTQELSSVAGTLDIQQWQSLGQIWWVEVHTAGHHLHLCHCGCHSGAQVPAVKRVRLGAGWWPLANHSVYWVV